MVKSAHRKLTIEGLRGVFAYFGLPDQIVTDNKTIFVNEEFAQFL